MNALILFLATASLVFALGLQSLNVNGRHFVAAGCTSLLIGAANLVLFKTLPGPTSALELAAYLTGGPVGILLAMHTHPRLVGLWARLADRRRQRKVVQSLPVVAGGTGGQVVCLSGASVPLPTIEAPAEPASTKVITPEEDFFGWVEGGEAGFFWGVIATAVAAWIAFFYALANLAKWMSS